MVVGVCVVFPGASFVTIFFNCALAACVQMRFAGETPTIAGGLSRAAARIHVILLWALVTSTVGRILEMLERDAGLIARIAISLVGLSWNMATFLMVPVLVMEHGGVMDSVRRSASLLRQTWGEQLISGFAFGWAALLLAIPGVVLGALGANGYPIFIVPCILWFAVMLAAFTAAREIFTVVLYRYATTGESPAGYDANALRGALPEVTIEVTHITSSGRQVWQAGNSELAGRLRSGRREESRRGTQECVRHIAARRRGAKKSAGRRHGLLPQSAIGCGLTASVDASCYNRNQKGELYDLHLFACGTPGSPGATAVRRSDFRRYGRWSGRFPKIRIIRRRTRNGRLRPTPDRAEASQFDLGVLYAQGMGVRRDLTQAANWYRKAAEQGNGEAQFALGQNVLARLGSSARIGADAIRWFQMANSVESETVLPPECA